MITEMGLRRELSITDNNNNIDCSVLLENHTTKKQGISKKAIAEQ
jgi:hypothetical protein